MPDPNAYESEKEWMAACMPKMMGEGKEQEQAAAACMSMWREKSAVIKRIAKHLIARKAESLQDQLEAVYSAFNGQFPPPDMSMPMEMPPSYYVDDIYPDYVIVCGNGKYFKVSYTKDNGKIVFASQAEWVEVEEQTTYSPVKYGARHTTKEMQAFQTVHDIMVENGANCAKKDIDLPDDTPAFVGGEIKALDDNGKVGGYLVRFSSEDDPDLTGDYFSTKTDFGEVSRLPLLYHHGMDAKIGKRRIGTSEVRKDDAGLWAESQLELRDEYEKLIFEMAKAGKLGYSSGAAAHTVSREAGKKAAHISQWYMAEASLTPTPAEPRNSVIPIKSLITSDATQQGDKEDHEVKSNKEFNMDEKEFKAMLEENNKTIVESVKAEAKTAADTAVKEALEALPEVKAGYNTRVEVTKDESDREFRNLAEQMRAVKSYTTSNGRQFHPRLKFLEEIARHEVPEPTEEQKAFSFKEILAMPLKAPLGMNEGIPSDGGFLLEPTLTNEFLAPIHDNGVFSQDVRTLPVGANSNYGWINGIDETSRANGSRWGGVLGYWRSEVQTATATKPKFRRINWELKDLDVLMYITDDQLADAAMTDAIARQSAIEELDFDLNDAILNGNGVGKPLGVLNSGALISIARHTLAQINHVDVAAMWQRLSPRSRAKAKWYINSECEPQLDKLAFTSNAGTTEMMSPYVRYDVGGVMTIKGRPVVVTEFNAALGTVGDILLADMTEYLHWEKGGVQSSVNPWLQWLTHENAFRWTYRCDGQTALYSAISPYKGSNTQSPFVTLATSTS